MRTLTSCCIAALLAGCGDLEVRSIPGEQTVSSSLLGEWRGTWQSDLTGDHGEIVLRLQEFRGEPVVSFALDNPCLTPDRYDLVLSGGGLSLESEGVPVVAGSLVSATRIAGAFGCAGDEGTWFADRIGGLPELVDLAGSWSGHVALGGAGNQPVEAVLEQRVEGGRLVLDASLSAQGLWPTPVPMTGPVIFRADGFDVLLASDPALQPEFLFLGMGEREPLAIPDAQLFVLSTAAGVGLQLQVTLEPN